MTDHPGLTLRLVKARLNRLDSELDAYLTQRISAADGELARIGIHIRAADPEDTMLLVDYVAWQYQNRDTPGDMPDWLRRRRRERWVSERGRG